MPKPGDPGRKRYGGLVGRLQEAAEDKIGVSLVPTRDAQLLESAFDELRAVNRELDLLGWQVLDYMGNQPNELTLVARRKMVQRARHVWMNDPQAGASVSLMNDFVFGRGVPRPRAKDKLVQEILDEFWDDPDNKRVLTTYSRQIAMGTDLALQSNLFVKVFDDGDDGKVKLTLQPHDTVEGVVRDPENYQRVIYYIARERKVAWDFENDRPMQSPTQNMKPVYYEDWVGMKEAQEEEGREGPVPTQKAARVGKGRIYHIAINRYSDQVFGVPEFQRVIRWYSAYNEFMKARVDIAQASAAFIMKRKIKGTANQLARSAARALSRRSDLAGFQDPTESVPPRPGAILEENDAVSHENFKIDSGAGNAAQDAQMIRAPVSAATRFPQSYYGDATNSNLATATSLELPVLKAVESRQEVFEGLIRDLLDRVIERAVDTGQISNERSPEEIDQLLQPGIDAQLAAAKVSMKERGMELMDAEHRVVGSKREGYTLRLTYYIEEQDAEGNKSVREAHEDKTVDESMVQRDLGYEFSMPSPLRRMMTDLVSAVQTIAATFDPNNTNTELSRALLTIVLGEGLEVQDPADMVDLILPKGYIDPLMAAQMQPPAGDGSGNPFGPEGADQPFPPGGDSNAYSSPMNARQPERMPSSGPYAITQAEEMEEGEWDEILQAGTRGQQARVARMFDEEVGAVAVSALNRELLHKEDTT